MGGVIHLMKITLAFVLISSATNYQRAMFVHARPQPDSVEIAGGDFGLSVEAGDGDGSLLLDTDKIKTYVDGTWVEKYDEPLTLNHKGDSKDTGCNDAVGGCKFAREGSIGTDYLGAEHKTNYHIGLNDAGNSTFLGASIKQDAKLKIGESSINYNFDTSSGAGYDQSGYGGEIGAKAEVGGGVESFGVGLGAKIAVGLAAEGGINTADNNLGAKVTTPVGEFGAKFGCKNEVCIFGCVSLSVC